MLKPPTERDLEVFFEEVWQVVEAAADAGDRHIFPRLLEIANDIVAWRNALHDGRQWADPANEHQDNKYAP